MTWTRHCHDEGRRYVWLDETTSRTRAVAVDARGVHPRLDARDHRDRTVLEDRLSVEYYIDLRQPDGATAALLRAAVAMVPHIRALWAEEAA